MEYLVELEDHAGTLLQMRSNIDLAPYIELLLMHYRKLLADGLMTRKQLAEMRILVVSSTSNIVIPLL